MNWEVHHGPEGIRHCCIPSGALAAARCDGSPVEGVLQAGDGWFWMQAFQKQRQPNACLLLAVTRTTASLVLAFAKLPAGVLLPVLGTLGCTTQAWAASKSQLPSPDTGDAERSCWFLGDLGLLPPAQKLPGAGSVSLELTATMTAASFPSQSFLILSIGASLRCCSCCALATKTFVFSPGLLCGKGFFLSLSLDPAGSDLLEPGLLPKPTCKSTDPLLFCCGLSPDVASFD